MPLFPPRHIEVHVHIHETADPAVLVKLDQILAQGVKIMAVNQEVRDYLAGLDTLTNEIAADIEDLLAKIAAGETLDPATRAAMQANIDTLKAIAAKHDSLVLPPTPPQ